MGIPEYIVYQLEENLTFGVYNLTKETQLIVVSTTMQMSYRRYFVVGIGEVTEQAFAEIKRTSKYKEIASKGSGTGLSELDKQIIQFYTETIGNPFKWWTKDEVKDIADVFGVHSLGQMATNMAYTLGNIGEHITNSIAQMQIEGIKEKPKPSIVPLLMGKQWNKVEESLMLQGCYDLALKLIGKLCGLDRIKLKEAFLYNGKEFTQVYKHIDKSNIMVHFNVIGWVDTTNIAVLLVTRCTWEDADGNIYKFIANKHIK